MESTIRFFRVRGVPVGANWSWLFVFALVVWSLGTALFPATYPGLSGSTYLVMALVASGLFFTSIVLHELGHTFRALAEGMRIRGITLWLFGGVARFETPFPSPGAEFRVAIAGPAVSAGLAVGFALATAGLGAAGAPDGVVGVADYVARINGLLLAFNLVPALPLDGGRVLHAWLWHRQRSATTATVAAARAGKAFGVLLVAAGLLSLFTGGDVGGLWFVFLGWFLIQAAQAEVNYALVEHALGGLHVRDLMVREPVTVSAAQTIDGFLADAPAGHFGSYPVVSEGRVVGLLPTRRAALIPAAERRSRTVGEVMVARGAAPTVRPGTALLDALPALGKVPGRAVVVDDDDRVVGLLSSSDVLRAIEFDRLRPPVPGRPARRGLGVWLVVGTIMTVAAGVLYHPPYVVIEPGESFDISGDITITGADTQPVSGRYLLTSVRLTQPSALGTVWAAFRHDREVLSMGDVLPQGVDPSAYATWQKQLFPDSRELAAVAAAKASGLQASVTGSGAEVLGVVRSAPAADVLKAGDAIVAVDGEAIATATDLHDLIAARPAGTTFTLTVERGGQRTPMRVRSAHLPQVSGGTGLGVFAKTRDLRADLPFQVRFRERSDIGDTSAGLAYALAMADMLDTTDDAHGRSVGATGTMDADGHVGDVGGVREKAVAVHRAAAALFLVPADELRDVDTPGLAVRGVVDLSNALRALRAS